MTSFYRLICHVKIFLILSAFIQICPVSSIHSGHTAFTQMGMTMQATANRYMKLYDEYSKIKIGSEYLKQYKSKPKVGPNTEVPSESMFVYYDEKSMELSLSENYKSDVTGQRLVAQGKYIKSRYKTGWDKLNIKTYKDSNPLVQCWVAGFIEGFLSAEEIGYYYSNIHVFFHNKEQYVKDIKNFYGKIDAKIREKVKPENLNKLPPHEFQQWSYITCLNAQLDGLHTGYNIAADEDKQLELLDFYFINSEGNFMDLKTFMKINKMKVEDASKFYTKENLMKVYQTTNIEKIWQDLTRKGHCSAIVKLVKNTNKSTGATNYDMIAGHNTWSEYCEMLRTLKYIEWAFEGDTQIIGMKPRVLNYSSYPGVLFSGDDFYLIDNKISILQTTLSAINKFIYKDLIDLDNYIPEFMRIMITNLSSNSGKQWADNYSSYKNHMYITQWIVLDYNTLDTINMSRAEDLSGIQGLVTLVEEVPSSIVTKDISQIVINDSYFGSFNLPYFDNHKDVLGLKEFKGVDFSHIQYNPRFYILKSLNQGVSTIYDFQHLILYNGYKQFNPRVKNDPSFSEAGNGISARSDLGQYPVFHGGIDFKIVNKELVNSMTIYTYGGPSFDQNKNLQPFDFKDLTGFRKDYHKGIPERWEFSPFFFSKKDFQ